MLGQYPEEAAGYRAGIGEETARAAAELQNRSLHSIRALVLAEFGNGSGTPEAICERLAQRGHALWYQTVRARVSDLGRLGKLIPTGERGPSMSGAAKSLVWRKAKPAEVATFEAKRAAKAEAVEE
jgi:hypothetical protein